MLIHASIIFPALWGTQGGQKGGPVGDQKFHNKGKGGEVSVLNTAIEACGIHCVDRGGLVLRL